MHGSTSMADGDWDDPYEQIFVDQMLVKGENVLTFEAPGNIESTASYARFRYSSEQGLGVTGEAPDGEVEDYQVYIVNALLDFGDAPESYGTTLEDDGARHETSTSLVLGSIVDNEIDGRAHPNALGDDQIGILTQSKKKSSMTKTVSNSSITSNPGEP